MLRSSCATPSSSLARGDVGAGAVGAGFEWASGSPIIFDAYGAGPAPETTQSLSLAAGSWTQVSGYSNQWSAAVTSTAMNYVLFGTIWGTKQTSQAALQHDRDFYYSGGLLYVYSSANPATYYGAVTAMLVTGAPLVSVSGKQWLTFQHLRIDWFDLHGHGRACRNRTRSRKTREGVGMSFGFKNIGHFFATVAGDIVKGA